MLKFVGLLNHVITRRLRYKQQEGASAPSFFNIHKMKNLLKLQNKIKRNITLYFNTHGECNIGKESCEDLFELIDHEFEKLNHKIKWDGIYQAQNNEKEINK